MKFGQTLKASPFASANRLPSLALEYKGLKKVIKRDDDFLPQVVTKVPLPVAEAGRDCNPVKLLEGRTYYSQIIAKDNAGMRARAISGGFTVDSSGPIAGTAEIQIAFPTGFDQQPGFPENAMWRRQDVQFVTLHVVGTNDGLGQIQLDDPLVARQQVARRQRAVRDWLATAAAAAKEAGAAALVVAMQADPFRGWGKESCRVKGPETCDAFAELRTAIVATARDLDRPMLVVHGDTAAYCLDQPFGADAPAGLWRLNGPGDFKVIDGARVTTSPGSAVPFQVTGLLTGPLAPGACQ